MYMLLLKDLKDIQGYFPRKCFRAKGCYHYEGTIIRNAKTLIDKRIIKLFRTFAAILFFVKNNVQISNQVNDKDKLFLNPV